MAAIPLILGLIFVPAHTSFAPVHVAVALLWISGYFWFNTISLWIKTAPSRRTSLKAPLFTYTGLVAAFGVLSLLLGLSTFGVRILLWLAWFGLWIALFFSQALTRQERSMLSGLSTIVAASSLILVLTCLDPTVLWLDWGRTKVDVFLTVLISGYFIGTVLVVKTVVRKRGSRGWLVASWLYHLVLSAIPLLVSMDHSIASRLWMAWSGLFVAVLGQSVFFPLAQSAGREVTPRVVGVTQVGLSLAVFALAVVTHFRLT